MKFFFQSVIVICLCCGCSRRVDDPIEPKIQYAVQDKYLKQLPSPFAPLSPEERAEDWGKEMVIGCGFARTLDLYQAITAFKRASLLGPPSPRDLECLYEILLCYYLGQRYAEVVETFEGSSLEGVDDAFPAFFDLLTILYDSYEKTGQEEKAAVVLHIIREKQPKLEESLSLYSAFMQGDLNTLCAHSELYVQEFCELYRSERRSPRHAQWLSALLPGAGYWYIGQKQSAATAFLLNGLFIAAAWHCFNKGEIAAGAILTSFEMGWYFGGIRGAQQEAKLYNERLYERYATPLMHKHHLFPVLTLGHAF